MDPFERIAAFLAEIGLPVLREPIDTPTFLPGLTIRNGALIADLNKLAHPGDLLHEAGHLAMLPAAERAQATAPIDPELGMEIGAIAWSWAALTHLGLDPAVVFHKEGYRGSSAWFIATYAKGANIGAPLLAWMELTTEASYPSMQRWLRE